MIICAAIHITFTRAGKMVEAVVPGHRHSDCWELMSTLGVPTDRVEVEGFIDHRGAFLDRYEAFTHAVSCGQLSDTTCVAKAERRETALYSEDLY